MDKYYLKDIWRVQNEDLEEYSWMKRCRQRENDKASRIDFALVSGGLDQTIKNPL